MPLWNKTDEVAGRPKYWSRDVDDSIYLVDNTEAEVASNRAKGLKTPGWNTYITYTDSNGNTRHKSETLVALNVSSVDAGDTGANDIVVGDIVNGTDYLIVNAGTTDFTELGAADNDAGTSFTADTANTDAIIGTGTVQLTGGDDSVVADS